MPKAVIGELSFQQTAMFTTADLLIAPGLAGQIQRSQQIRNDRGEELHFLSWERHALSIPHDAPIPTIEEVVQLQEGKPVLPIYVLTEVGFAVASILVDQQDIAFANLIRKLKSVMPDVAITEYRKNSKGFGLVRIH